jgi:hypothetical protein
MSFIDLRRGTRYLVQLLCRVTSPLQAFGDLSGMTLNMSRSGVLISFPEAGPRQVIPNIGAPARILVELPHPPQSSPRCLDCLGRVVRVDQRDAACHVAFVVRRFEFREPPAGEDARAGFGGL